MYWRFVSFLCVMVLGASVALASDLFVSLSDMTAGQDQPVRITGLQTAEPVELSLIKPNQNLVTLDFTADANGVLSTALYGLHLREAGQYDVVIQRPTVGNLQVRDSFTVSPGTVSAYRSSVESLVRAAPADGRTRIDLSIVLRDAYNNPVPGQAVSLISSRHQDAVISGLLSDGQGRIEAALYTDEPGVSVVSVLVDGVVLLDRPELIWHLPADTMISVGQSESSGLGSFLKAQLFDDDFFDEAAYLTIEDLPSEVVVGRNYTFRVEAKDQDGNIVKDYANRVRFSSTDAQAQLPADYRFEAADQGIHTFALAVDFVTPGTQTLTVTDLSNAQVTGAAEINVVPAAGGSNTGDGIEGISILTPSPGTYRTSRVTITGVAPRNTLLKIVDGPTTLIEDLVVDSSGEFVYQTPALADGLHKFVVASMDGSLISPEVSIRVDQTPPRVLAVELDPASGVAANQVFQVNVSSNEPLSAATCTFNGVTAELSPAGDRFNGTFEAPGACGEYPMACTVADVLGNELVEPNAAVVPVCTDAPVPVDPVVLESTETNTAVPPTAVDNVSAEPGDKRVTLYWSPAKDDTEVIAYQIDYGTSPQGLVLQNITPDDRTQWYVDGLKEGTKYYFTVLAVDANGNKSTPSQVVEATTFGDTGFRSAAVPESGAKLWLPIVLALSFGFFFLGMSLRRR